MNWTQIAVNWSPLKGRAKEHWARLTLADLARINGKHDQLVSRVRERYGLARKDAERQVKHWAGTC